MANVKIAENNSTYDPREELRVDLSLVCHNPTQERVGLLINRYAVMAQNGIGLTAGESRETVKMKPGVWDTRSQFSVYDSFPAKIVPPSVDPTKGDSLKFRVNSVFYGVERHTIIDVAVPKKPTKKQSTHDRPIVNINSAHLDSKISTLIYSFIDSWDDPQEGCKFFVVNKTDQELYVGYNTKVLDEDGDTVDTHEDYDPLAANSAKEFQPYVSFEEARGGSLKVELMVYYKIHEEVNEFDIPLNQSSNDESDDSEENEYEDDDE